MKNVVLVFGIVASLLGGLWLLQGLNIVHVQPILCLADCAPVGGASPKWAIFGAVLLVSGVAAVWWYRKRKFKRATTKSNRAK